MRLNCYLFGCLIESPQQTVRHVPKINHISKLEKRDFYRDIFGVKPTFYLFCFDKQMAESALIKHVKATTHINQNGRICVQMQWKPGFPYKPPNNYFRAQEQMRKRESELAKNGRLDDTMVCFGSKCCRLQKVLFI